MNTKPEMPAYTCAAYGVHDHITDDDIAGLAKFHLAMVQYRQDMKDWQIANAIDAIVSGPDAM